MKAQGVSAAETISFETGPNPTHGAWDVVRLEHGAHAGIYEETAWSLTLALSLIHI